MSNSPFKFLDSCTQSDKDIFFGREAEIEEVYSRLFTAGCYQNTKSVSGWKE